MTSRPPIQLPTDGLTLTITQNVKRDQSFYDMLLNYSDVFMSGYSGYWAFGVKVNGGWLAFDFGDEEPPSDAKAERVRAKFNEDRTIPPRWYLINLETVDRIVTEGCKRYGFDFQEQYDATSLDVAVQLALLGDIVYG
jgi:hypothetical protein